MPCEPYTASAYRRRSYKAAGAALCPATFVIVFADRIGGTSCAIVPQHTQVIANVARKAFSALSPINKQFIEIGTQGARVHPHCGDEIGDSRVAFAERARLDSKRQSVEPFLCVRQEYQERQCLALS